jgi:hypothetical protein
MNDTTPPTFDAVPTSISCDGFCDYARQRQMMDVFEIVDDRRRLSWNWLRTVDSWQLLRDGDEV